MNTIRAAVVLALLAALVLLAAACQTRYAGTPLFVLPATNDPLVLGGEQAFLRHCHECHPGGEAGMGPSVAGRALPDGLIRFQVRNGLGAMPSFSEEQIPDEELDGIIAYINALQRHKAEGASE